MREEAEAGKRVHRSKPNAGNAASTAQRAADDGDGEAPRADDVCAADSDEVCGVHHTLHASPPDGLPDDSDGMVPAVSPDDQVSHPAAFQDDADAHPDVLLDGFPDDLDEPRDASPDDSDVQVPDVLPDVLPDGFPDDSDVPQDASPDDSDAQVPDVLPDVLLDGFPDDSDVPQDASPDDSDVQVPDVLQDVLLDGFPDDSDVPRDDFPDGLDVLQVGFPDGSAGSLSTDAVSRRTPRKPVFQRVSVMDGTASGPGPAGGTVPEGEAEPEDGTPPGRTEQNASGPPDVWKLLPVSVNFAAGTEQTVSERRL